MNSNTSFLSQTPYTDPGPLGEGGILDVRALPRDPWELAGLVRGVLIHIAEAAARDYAIPLERLHEDPQSRYVSVILRLLRERSPAPLTEERPYAERVLATCRDFAVLHCALLRATGTPARVRCGFATYFLDGYHDDHWVTEYRLPDGTWRLTDAQLADGRYDVSFSPADVPRDRFLVGADAWRACREGRADPTSFGVSSIEGVSGLWFVAADTVRDLAALNGVEALPWDGWGIAAVEGDEDPAFTAADRELLDRVAAATAADDLPLLRRLYAHPRLRVPAEILSFTTFTGVRRVTLPIAD
ncbi:transglutaminase domain-containing protein [Streptomyces sp. NPDC059578]|uniref:transglutaminase domain-containing protein n=1 Tax=Streptomyces sp. NPDC059578 TaxID=3346874 RepID=UPI00367DDF4F